MSLVVITGAARSGKSTAAERLAAGRRRRVIVAVGGRADDGEMERRIAEHRALRPGSFEVIEVGPDPAWVTELPIDAVLLVECLGTLIGIIVAEEVTSETEATAMNERIVQRRANALVGALCARTGDTVVVTNETGWGVVPPSPAGRLFRDVMGRANRALVERADAAYLALAGRFVDLRHLPADAVWPAASDGEDA